MNKHTRIAHTRIAQHSFLILLWTEHHYQRMPETKRKIGVSKSFD
jgi:hypothetical protein